jgi:general stress protein YciG
LRYQRLRFSVLVQQVADLLAASFLDREGTVMAERRGFAAMDENLRRQIAARGGRAAHEAGNAHEWNAHEAAEAGRKGGQKVSRNRQHMAEIGRKGGLAAHHRDENGQEANKLSEQATSPPEVKPMVPQEEPPQDVPASSASTAQSTQKLPGELQP